MIILTTDPDGMVSSNLLPNLYVPVAAGFFKGAIHNRVVSDEGHRSITPPQLHSRLD